MADRCNTRSSAAIIQVDSELMCLNLVQHFNVWADKKILTVLVRRLRDGGESAGRPGLSAGRRRPRHYEGRRASRGWTERRGGGGLRRRVTILHTYLGI